MPHEQDEIEGMAVDMILQAGCDPRLPVLAVTVARGTPGVDVVYRTGIQCSRIVPANDDGDLVIEVPAGLSLEIAQGEIRHELSELWLGRRGYAQPDVETECGRLERAIGAPDPAFRAALRGVGYDLEHLSAMFLMPQTDVVRRIGEVTGHPCALIAPSYVERGGADVLPDDQTLRAIAVAGGFGAVKVLRLTDVARRWFVISTR